MACMICGGDKHEGKCPPENFLYYRCTKCKNVFDMPWDSVAFCGLAGIGCCVTEDDPRFADELWESITYEEFLTEQKEAKEMANEAELEKEIQDKGLNAPRLTPEKIDAVIADKDFHVFEKTCLTVCCLTLKNGFTVTGESACASPENFDEEIGQKIAFDNARNKIWALEGYLLKERLNA